MVKPLLPLLQQRIPNMASIEQEVEYTIELETPYRDCGWGGEICLGQWQIYVSAPGQKTMRIGYVGMEFGPINFIVDWPDLSAFADGVNRVLEQTPENKGGWRIFLTN